MGPWNKPGVLCLATKAVRLPVSEILVAVSVYSGGRCGESLETEGLQSDLRMLVLAPLGRQAVLWGRWAAEDTRVSPGELGTGDSLEHCHRKERGWGSGLLRVSTECISFSSCGRFLMLFP